MMFPDTVVPSTLSARFNVMVPLCVSGVLVKVPVNIPVRLTGMAETVVPLLHPIKVLVNTRAVIRDISLFIIVSDRW